MICPDTAEKSLKRQAHLSPAVVYDFSNNRGQEAPYACQPIIAVT